MENGDLKRYYKVNNQDAKDFARLNADGKIDKDLLPSDVGTTVVANPTGTATDDLTKLQVGETIYDISAGTEVIANPTLAGTEDSLNGLQVGDTKYKVEAGYEIHSYDANTSYTKAGQTTIFNQLLEDIQKGMPIKVGNYYFDILSVTTLSASSTEYAYTTTDTQTSWSSISGKKVTITHTTSGNESLTISAISTQNVAQGISQSDADARYLKLTGGTMTGTLLAENIKASNTNGLKLLTQQGYPTINLLNNEVRIGDNTVTTGIRFTEITNGGPMVIQRGGGLYMILDSLSTSANPTLSGTETSLTSLKLNGTNYAIAGGTQVTFVDWS